MEFLEYKALLCWMMVVECCSSVWFGWMDGLLLVSPDRRKMGLSQYTCQGFLSPFLLQYGGSLLEEGTKNAKGVWFVAAFFVTVLAKPLSCVAT